MENISGLRAVSMVLWDRDGKLWKSIFVNRILMNIIGKISGFDSYMPRTIRAGYTVTEDDGRCVHPQYRLSNVTFVELNTGTFKY